MNHFLCIRIYVAMFLLFIPMMTYSNHHHSHSQGLLSSAICHHACHIDTDLAIAKFEEDRSNPIAGKNVLIIGASKGNGNGAAQAFYNAGANVVGTSRSPSDYTGQPWLSPVPIDITIDASVQNFFNNEPTLARWDHIDILVLGGAEFSYGTLFQSKAAELFVQMNTEFLGRHRVVERAIKWMKDVDDSRMITLSSTAGALPLMGLGAYTPTKGALNGWVKQWNIEREWMKELAGHYVVKTIAIACQPSFVLTSNGSLPPSLCNPVAPFPFAVFGSGIQFPLSQPMVEGLFGYLGNSQAQNLTKEMVGKAILYMATVKNPEWQYIVENGDEQICLCNDNIGINCFYKKASQHKVRDILTQWIRKYNWNAAFDNILYGNNSKNYSAFICPSCCHSALLTPVPPLPAGYPDCTNGTIPGLEPNTLTIDNVIDLFNNPCKPNNPCP